MKFWDRLAPQHNRLLIFCLIISAFFAFANLGNVYLNTDEAETAVLARNVLKFGLPLADKKYRPLLQAEYDKIEIDYPEIHWENLPEPAYHKYMTVKGADKVVLYRRR